MHSEFFNIYPELEKIFKKKRSERIYEILNNLKNDEIYCNLLKKKTEQSMIVLNTLNDIYEFERYADLVYELELYELDAVYSYAFIDALLALRSLIPLKKNTP